MNDNNKTNRNDSSNTSLRNEKYYSKVKSEIWSSKLNEREVGRTPFYNVLHQMPGPSCFARISCDSVLHLHCSSPENNPKINKCWKNLGLARIDTTTNSSEKYAAEEPSIERKKRGPKMDGKIQIVYYIYQKHVCQSHLKVFCAKYSNEL